MLDNCYMHMYFAHKHPQTPTPSPPHTHKCKHKTFLLDDLPVLGTLISVLTRQPVDLVAPPTCTYVIFHYMYVIHMHTKHKTNLPFWKTQCLCEEFLPESKTFNSFSSHKNISYTHFCTINAAHTQCTNNSIRCTCQHH